MITGWGDPRFPEGLLERRCPSLLCSPVPKPQQKPAWQGLFFLPLVPKSITFDSTGSWKL